MKAGLKTVTTAFEIMGGPTTGVTFTSTEKFRSENPKIFAAVNKAFDELVRLDQRGQAPGCQALHRDDQGEEADRGRLDESFSSADMEYTKVPSRVGKLLDFMHATALVKNKPASWKDLFFAEAHGLPGS